MDIREEIISKVQELNSYLEGISLDELKKKYTRVELNEFVDKLRNEETRYLAYEISQLTAEMKKEEFPDLLGVHYFPVIKEMEFLTQDEKIKLDKYLARLRKGYRADNWHLVTNDNNKHIPIKDFLLEKEIVSKKFLVLCPHCNDTHISEYLTKEQMEEFKTNLKNYHNDKNDESLIAVSKIIDGNYCDECDEDYSVEDIKSYRFEEYTLMNGKPDLTLEKTK